MKPHTVCRACGHLELEPLLDLKRCRLLLCPRCCLGQLDKVDVTFDCLDGTDCPLTWLAKKVEPLAKREALTLEVPYLRRLVELGAWDEVRPSRLSYYSARSLMELVKGVCRIDHHEELPGVRLRNTEGLLGADRCGQLSGLDPRHGRHQRGRWRWELPPSVRRQVLHTVLAHGAVLRSVVQAATRLGQPGDGR
jgi:hypothetical protein